MARRRPGPDDRRRRLRDAVDRGAVRARLPRGDGDGSAGPRPGRWGHPGARRPRRPWAAVGVRRRERAGRQPPAPAERRGAAQRDGGQRPGPRRGALHDAAPGNRRRRRLPGRYPCGLGRTGSEVGRMSPLTPEQAAELLATVERDGYVIVPGVIPPEELGGVDELVARVHAAYDRLVADGELFRAGGTISG